MTTQEAPKPSKDGKPKAEPATAADPPMVTVPAAVPESLRSTLLASGSPHCGRLREEDLRALFGEAAEGIASVALVPLGAGAVKGLLVLGSTDTAHFHPGMATDFLARSFTWQLPGLAAARGLGLAALQALPPLKSALARQMMFGRR